MISLLPKSLMEHLLNCILCYIRKKINKNLKILRLKR
nr:MAG TPA: hypothetical protein [Caudoviricetes sp.]